jgi:hypothetical protein
VLYNLKIKTKKNEKKNVYAEMLEIDWLAKDNNTN